VLPSTCQIQGVILADQIKSLDWKARDVKFIESAPIGVIEEVQAKIEPLFLSI
jgi:mRNA interferase MazF